MSLDGVVELLRKEADQMRNAILIGIGNELNGDDGVGPYIADVLTDSSFFTTFNAGTQPDNFTGKIALLNPSHVIILDAAMIEGEPGAIAPVPLDEIDEVCFHTHYLPLRHVVKRLMDKCDCKVLVIGISPDSMDPGEGLSQPVKQAADRLITRLKELDHKDLRN